MQLSNDLINVLKNFSSINANLVIKKGKTVSTMSSAKDIMAEFNGKDEFEKPLAIFNLNEFLGVLSAFDAPTLDLEDKYVTISQGKQKVKYVYADECHLTSPQKSIKFPGADISFALTPETLSKLQKMSAILAAEDLAIVGNGKKVTLKIFDKKNPSNNVFEIETDAKTDDDFEVLLKIEKLKLIQGTYTVDISNKKISRFTNEDLDVVYFVAVEADSKFPAVKEEE